MIYANAAYLAKIAIVARGRNALPGYAEHALNGSCGRQRRVSRCQCAMADSRARPKGAHFAANIHHKVCAGFGFHMLGKLIDAQPFASADKST